MLREDLLHLLNETLTPSLFKDYAPNGLQVEGKTQINHIVTAVTATQNVIDRACELGSGAVKIPSLFAPNINASKRCSWLT